MFWLREVSLARTVRIPGAAHHSRLPACVVVAAAQASRRRGLARVGPVVQACACSVGGSPGKVRARSRSPGGVPRERNAKQKIRDRGAERIPRGIPLVSSLRNDDLQLWFCEPELCQSFVADAALQARQCSYYWQ